MHQPINRGHGAHWDLDDLLAFEEHHVDLDAYSGPIEQCDYPEWLDKPVIAGARLSSGV